MVSELERKIWAADDTSLSVRKSAKRCADLLNVNRYTAYIYLSAKRAGFLNMTQYNQVIGARANSKTKQNEFENTISLLNPKELRYETDKKTRTCFAGNESLNTEKLAKEINKFANEKLCSLNKAASLEAYPFSHNYLVRKSIHELTSLLIYEFEGTSEKPSWWTKYL